MYGAALVAGVFTTYCGRCFQISTTSGCSGIYRQANLAVRKRPINEWGRLQFARTANEVWSMDFVSDSLAGGRRLKCLTAADDVTHESVGIVMDLGISVQHMTRGLKRAGLFRGYPKVWRAQTTARTSPAGHSWPGIMAGWQTDYGEVCSHSKLGRMPTVRVA